MNAIYYDMLRRVLAVLLDLCSDVNDLSVRDKVVQSDWERSGVKKTVG